MTNGAWYEAIFLGAFCDCPDALFGNPILPEGANSAKCWFLLSFDAGLLKRLCCIGPIISTNKSDVDVVMAGPVFNFFFAL
jgi:hypothetical protein